MSNEVQMVFGSPTTVISLAATLANAANTYAGLSGLTMTQLDNSTLLYPKAKAVLDIADTFAAAPTAGGTVDLYYIEDDVDGTQDETPEPAATDITALAKYAGSWVVDNQDVRHVKAITIDLEGVRKARFCILNNTGQTLSYSTQPILVKITPFSYKPAA